MTTYAAVSNSVTSTTAGQLTIVPSSTYQVRIAKAEFYANFANAAGYGQVNVYPSTTPSGGTTATPLSMRAGAPAASATVKTGATVSGTTYILHQAGFSDFSGNAVVASSEYSFPFDLIMSAGSTFVASINASSGILAAGSGIIVYFEELRLAWSG